MFIKLLLFKLHCSNYSLAVKYSGKVNMYLHCCVEVKSPPILYVLQVLVSFPVHVCTCMCLLLHTSTRRNPLHSYVCDCVSELQTWCVALLCSYRVMACPQCISTHGHVPHKSALTFLAIENFSTPQPLPTYMYVWAYKYVGL